MEIELLSPLHIGSGNVLSEIDYEYRDGKVIVFDFDLAYESGDERLRRWLEEGKYDSARSALRKYARYEIDSFCVPSSIAEAIKIGNKPYIPGSSIKGAIRTAILWKYMKDRDVKAHNPSELSRIERELFGKPQADFMKFFRISDSSFAKIEDVGVYALILFSEDEGILKQRSVTAAECIKSGTKFALSLDVDLKRCSKDKVCVKRKDFLEKWDEITAEFSRHVLNEDIRFFEERNDGSFDELIKWMHNLKDELESKILLRLGFGTGWLWKSVGSLLSREERIEVGRKLKLNMGKVGLDFPKTRKVVDEKGKFRLAGWVEVV
ncbi:type III-A CRISPR-associated RAMP protein Csm5 [Archaeoglobales archaeon]|nr:MAG: type III-A CRISPR-associated RAMP protein Csm5 [Archaeoglobales archaeon]